MAPLIVVLAVWLIFQERFSHFFALLAAIFSAGYTISLKQIRNRLPVPTVMLLISLVSCLTLLISTGFP
jgi:drug/metabolite transporter (DMT)-like permease